MSREPATRQGRNRLQKLVRVKSSGRYPAMRGCHGSVEGQNTLQCLEVLEECVPKLATHGHTFRVFKGSTTPTESNNRYYDSRRSLDSIFERTNGVPCIRPLNCWVLPTASLQASTTLWLTWASSMWAFSFFATAITPITASVIVFSWARNSCSPSVRSIFGFIL